MLGHLGTFFQNGFDLIPDVVAGDVNTDITGDWISLKNWDRAYLVLIKPAGTAGDDLAIRLQQATDNAAGSAKALTFTKLWYKKGSTNSFAAVPTWTAVELTTASSDLDLDSVNSTDLALDTSAAVVIVEVRSDSLDGGNGFTHVNVLYEGDDIGNALVINSLWLMQGNQYPQSIPLSSL
jgi:hypothetical protein